VKFRVPEAVHTLARVMLRIWVDCTAAAHPLVMRPIVERLQARGDEVAITSRRYGQTEGMLDRLGLRHEVVGGHGGAGSTAKATALARRSAALARWARRGRFDLGLAHGSVDLAVVGSLLRIPSVQMQDYEFAGLQRRIAWGAARRIIVPDAIPIERLERAGAREPKLFRYPGLKEDYYLADFVPDPAVLVELGLEARGISARHGAGEPLLVIVRPPPETSAYHAENPLYDAVLDRLAASEETITVLIPRTARQRETAPARFAAAGRDSALVIPDHTIDAQSLIAYSDLVVSAGGTMNREAVALGTPVQTIFSGRMGAVDERLINAGLLRPLRDPDRLELRRRERPAGVREPRDPGLLVDAVLGAVSSR
jgi:predicted glycosyltransferase